MTSKLNKIEEKRIVLVSRFPAEIDKPRGGVETATVSLAKALFNAGATDLHIVTLEKGLERPVQQNYDGIQVHRLQRSGFPMLLDVFFGPTFYRLKRYLYQLKPDIVHFQETWGFGSYRYGLPTVFTVHGFDSLNLITEKKSLWKLRSKLWSWTEAYALRRQAAIISIAPYVRRMIEEHTDAPIYNIWNALGIDYFNVPRNEVAEYLMFMGWINPRKNPLVLVEVAARLKTKYPRLLIELCGEEDDKAYASLVKKRIVELGVEHNVKLVGRIGQQEVRNKLSRASVMVLPSLQENAPMVIAEAMAAKVPCVAANKCGIPDMITDQETGYLCDPNDIDSLTTHLDKLLSDAELRKETGSRAHDSAFEKFHPSSVASQTLDVYKNILG